MHPGATVVLATIWLVVSVGVTGGASLHPFHLTPDQYSPLPPHHPEVYRRVGSQLDWKDQDRAEDQPLDFLIGLRRSIPVYEQPKDPFQTEYNGKDATFVPMKHDVPINNDFSSLQPNKQSQNFAGSKLTNEGAGHSSAKVQESFSREVPVPELMDPFVADDTFQDQGPGSVEIYKLDLFKEKDLLSSTTTTKPASKNKSKVPKKTTRINWKAKTPEYKATSPKIHNRQSNSFDELGTEVPLNSEIFGIGGVPELQVGCEGLEASSHKLKRSIDSKSEEKGLRTVIAPSTDVVPVSLDLDYVLASEEGYEEMDELFKLKKLETTTKKPKQNRGDMDATLHAADFFGNTRHPEKLPVRGDLGKSNTLNKETRQTPAHAMNKQTTAEEHNKQSEAFNLDSATNNRGRKLLSLDESHDSKDFANRKRLKRAIWGYGQDEGVVSSDELQTENERRRQYYERKNAADANRHGYEDNRTTMGIEDTRQGNEMWAQRQREEAGRLHRLKQEGFDRTTTNRWQEEQRRRLEQRKREHEEGHARVQQRPRNLMEKEESSPHLQEDEQNRRNRWQEEQFRRQEEERKRQELEDSRRRYDHRSMTLAEKEQQWQRLRKQEMERQQKQEREEERRRQQYEEIRRRHKEEETRRRLQEDDARRRDQNRRQEEIQRRQQQEMIRKATSQNPEKNLPPSELRDLQERRMEWMRKWRQHEEEERRMRERTRNEGPSTLPYPSRSGTNETGRYGTEADRRIREEQERERERKLREYIQRNRPINVSRSIQHRGHEERRDLRWNMRNESEKEEEDRSNVEEQRKRPEEHRNFGGYDRSSQLVGNWSQNRRIIGGGRPYDYSRGAGSEIGRRNYGPSPPVNITPQSYTGEARRRQEARRLEEERMRERQRHEDEERKKEIRRREEEARRMQSRRYEEERKRLEAARLEDEKRRKELIEEEARRSQAGRTWPLEYTRLEYDDRSLQEHRRKDTSLIPGNLVLDESRRAAERERQRQAQDRNKLQVERRPQEDRVKGTIQREEHDKEMREEWKRQEEARLNALPVSARIIIHSGASPHSSTPVLVSRTGFENEIDFSGINPNRQGVPAPRFPATPTRRPPVKSPGACVWAVVQCCPTNRNRLVTCFETMGCPGVNWDPNPCRSSIAEAARDEVMKFYTAAERDEYL